LLDGIKMNVGIDIDGDVCWNDDDLNKQWFVDYEFLDNLIYESRKDDFVCRWMVLE